MIKIAILALALIIASPSFGAQKPKAASLDFCADQYLLKLGDREQIIALSRGADERDSYMREQAAGHKMIRPSREPIAALDVDMVLTQWGLQPRVQRDLNARNIAITSIDDPRDFDAIKASIQAVGDALGQTDRANALIDEVDMRLDALSARRTDNIKQSKTALYITPGGVTAGEGTLIDTMIRAAGFTNHASTIGKKGWSSFSLEALLGAPPDIIITGFFNAGAEAQNNWSAGRHPVFAKIFAATPTLHLPADILSCGGWFSLEGAEAIAEMKFR